MNPCDRRRLGLGLALALGVLGATGAVGCGDEAGPLDASTSPDATLAEDAAPTFGCGAAQCSLSTDYCLEVPTGPCEARDGGACAATEEPCVSQGVTGCTSPPSRRCEPIPAACGPLPPCACLPDQAPCPAPGTTCFRPADGGPVVTCAFP